MTDAWSEFFSCAERRALSLFLRISINRAKALIINKITFNKLPTTVHGTSTWAIIMSYFFSGQEYNVLGYSASTLSHDLSEYRRFAVFYKDVDFECARRHVFLRVITREFARNEQIFNSARYAA